QQPPGLETSSQGASLVAKLASAHASLEWPRSAGGTGTSARGVGCELVRWVVTPLAAISATTANSARTPCFPIIGFPPRPYHKPGAKPAIRLTVSIVSASAAFLS